MVRKSLVKRLVNQYSIAFVCALAWTFVNFMMEETKSWHYYFNIFGPTFFFFTWFVEQYFRVFTEDLQQTSFTKIERNLHRITNRVEDSNNKLVKTLENEKVYCSAILSLQGNNSTISIDFDKTGEGAIEDLEISFYGDIIELKSKNCIYKNDSDLLNSDPITFCYGGQESKILIVYSSKRNTWVQNIFLKMDDTDVKIHSDLEIHGRKNVDYYSISNTEHTF
ncbi:hypothetical protein [Aquimarina sp. 2201CG5-10]|uniref:hypothetical protein n=1 Tax=Aquimarina callyspongiae TaxID=3098150 RepID=UPI002AB3887C|nr:hypothetical protein [Aquimarina sp. 2201CG5-10]MDY8138723.1 hypothetical protein [Aquimarina sp. 2201CG5-10]